MMSKEKNYKQKDYQQIVVQKEKTDEVVQNYLCFGWKVESIHQHSYYENLLEVEFSRDHFVSSKDDLQFLQVGMECAINNQGRLEKNKHSRSTLLALLLGLLASCFVALSVLAMVRFNFNQALLWGCCFGIFALALFVLLPILTIKVFKKEKIIFEQKNAEYQTQIEDFCNQAKVLWGGKNEE